ncbi:MAG: hypothetical protein WDZ49_09780 [Litorilinea sp.]
MTKLNALPGFLAQLRTYDEGSRLKREAMAEVVQVLEHLEMSRRAFVRKAHSLGIAIPSFQSLGNWIACTHVPSSENVDRLMEALDMVLRESGESSAPWHSDLHESSHLHEHSLGKFHRDVQNLEQAMALCDSVIAWLTMTDLPPSIGMWPGSFIPITREHGIQCLDILRRIHFDLAENTRAPRALEHNLLAAKASIELAHQLNVTGRHNLALEAADEGGYVLQEILQKYPGWREAEIAGYRQLINERVTLSDLAFMALTRKATALHALSQLADSSRERNSFRGMVERTLSQAITQTQTLPADSIIKPYAWHTWAGFDLDNAQTMQDLQQAADHAKCAVEYSRQSQSQSRAVHVQRYVTLMFSMEAYARMGKLRRATALLTEGEQLEQALANETNLTLGPSQRVVYWRSLAAYWLTHAQREVEGSTRWQEYCRRWVDAATAGLHLARETGMQNQERRLCNALNQASMSYRRLLSGELTQVG